VGVCPLGLLLFLVLGSGALCLRWWGVVVFGARISFKGVVVVFDGGRQ
jgi:hypothetical protein